MASKEAEGEHLLIGVPRLWQQMRGEFEEMPSTDAASAEEAAVGPDELKKVTKLFQHVITKFGASASVAEGEEVKGLKPIAEEVLKAFTAAVGTLLSVKRGAGVSLLAELNSTCANLSSSLDELGKAVGTPSMARCAGKVLDRIKKFEKTSTHNRAAIMRRLLQNLSQIRDAQRELQETLDSGDGDDDDDDDNEEDDFGDGDFDTSLEPSERRVIEALVVLTGASVDVLKMVSAACMPAKQPDAVPVAISDLEVAVAHAAAIASSVDGLSVASTGGFDAKEFEKSLREMRDAVTGLQACPAVGEAAALSKALAAVEEASAAAVAEDAGCESGGYPPGR